MGPSDTSVWIQDVEYAKTSEEACYRGRQATRALVRKPDTEDQGRGCNPPGWKVGCWCFGLDWAGGLRLFQVSLNSFLALKLEVFICGL